MQYGYVWNPECTENKLKSEVTLKSRRDELMKASRLRSGSNFVCQGPRQLEVNPLGHWKAAYCLRQRLSVARLPLLHAVQHVRDGSKPALSAVL